LEAIPLPPALRRRYLASCLVSKVPHRFTDILVLGSGVAGLAAALAASCDEDVEVLVVAKSGLDDAATSWAQGGIAAVLYPERTGDSPEHHLQDTLDAAAGIADEEAAAVLVREGIERVEELLREGAGLDRTSDGLPELTREGAHSFPRILHRGDTTGQEIERSLLARVAERPNVLCLPSTFAVDLLTSDGACRGALLYRTPAGLEAAWARQTILATGGAGRLYRETTNPPVSTGDGIAMAFRAGVMLQDLEFVQFHPTTLYMAGAERFLITEAARGEGGVLVDGSGRPFMQRFHPLGDLAPRDVVSRAILQVMKERGDNKVWLDLSGIPPEKIRARFPRILEICRGFGIDILRQPIPVRPSAHYFIGGVKTNTRGETSLKGLLAAGEVACTGLHGANRLGSNSLLEGLVFGHRAGLLAASRRSTSEMPRPFSALADDGGSGDSGARPGGPEAAALQDEINREDLLSSLRSLLWYSVGVERDAESLRSALEQVGAWIAYGLAANFDEPVSWTLQNMLEDAFLVTLSALRREESRGVHYRGDFPQLNDRDWKRHQTLSRAEMGLE
jgi:L-aspartate oxidase